MNMELIVMDYSIMMLTELQRLEDLSEDYRNELRFLSKKIRKDFWNYSNESKLAKLLNKINNVYEMFFKYVNYFDLSVVIEYVRLLAK